MVQDKDLHTSVLYTPYLKHTLNLLHILVYIQAGSLRTPEGMSKQLDGWFLDIDYLVHTEKANMD